MVVPFVYTEEEYKKLEEENRKLKEERDFFKEQAILWRKDWKVAYEENIKLKEELGKFSESFKRYRDFEKQELADSLYDMEEENRKLKEDNRFLTKISKEYMKKENIIEVTEFTELYKDELEEKIRFLEQCLDNKEKVNKSLREENKKLKELKIFGKTVEEWIEEDKKVVRLD